MPDVAANNVSNVPDTLSFLLGRWRIVRQLSDQRNNLDATFIGTVSVTLSDRVGIEDARYEEHGTLQVGTQVSEAWRELSCRRTGQGSVETFLPSGALLVELDLRFGACCGEHRCGDDTYRLALRVVGPDQLAECWHVRGPCKAYEARATLTRLAPGAADVPVSASRRA